MTLFYLVLAWLAGIAIANGVDTPWWLWLTLMAPSLLGAVLARRSLAWRMVFGCVMCLSLGAARLSASVPHFTQSDLASYDDQGFVTVEGVITTPPQVIDAFAGFRVEVEQMALPDERWQQVHGLVLVQTAATQSCLAEQRRAIFDGEIGPACDDVGALGERMVVETG
ncbi:MAG: DUF4131 domain-containing protein [Anaerolineae bacterium]|nr:DUF4131 domain-containing protein [Anaerolineae bacterium]